MEILSFILCTFTFIDYCVLLMLWCGLYLLFIAPLLFRFWLIPKIEKRYQTKLRIDSANYLSPCANLTIPPMELSTYIFCKLIGLQVRGMKKPRPGSFFELLNKIDYDIKTASRSELIIGYMTVFFLISLFVSPAIFYFFGIKK